MCYGTPVRVSASVNPDWRGLESEPDRFVIAAFDEVETADPHKAYETGSRNVVANVYEPLLDLDPATGSVRPRLATAVPDPHVSGRGVTYHFQIRQGVRFHDGELLTAEDVEYSLRRLLLVGAGAAVFWREALCENSSGAPSQATLLAAAERIRADGTTVMVVLPSPYGPFLRLVANCSFVVSAVWCAQAGEWDGSLSAARPLAASALDRAANGTGPYILDAWDGAGLHFERFGAYWNEPASVKRIDYVSINERLTREDALVRGEVDFAVCQPESVHRLSGSPEITIEESEADLSVNPVGVLSFDVAPDPELVGTGDFGQDGMPVNALADPHLRAALSLCFDYARFEREALGGRVNDQHGLLPSALAAISPPAGIYDLDLARARLRRAAGGLVAEHGIRITSFTHQGNVAREIAAALLAEGFNSLLPRARIEVRPTNLRDLLDRAAQRRCPIGWIGWTSDFLHPHASLAPFLSEAWPLANGLSLANAKVQTLLTEALEESDDSAAMTLYSRINQWLISEHIMLFVPGKQNSRVFRSKWTGVDFVSGRANVLDFARFRWNPL